MLRMLNNQNNTRAKPVLDTVGSKGMKTPIRLLTSQIGPSNRYLLPGHGDKTSYEHVSVI